eukprot:gene2185-1353_t
MRRTALFYIRRCGGRAGLAVGPPLSPFFLPTTTSSPIAFTPSVGGGALLCAQRFSTVPVFTTALEQLQAQQRQIQSSSSSISAEERQSKLNDLMRQGKQLFDTDKLELSAEPGQQLTPEAAARIAQAAAQWRVSPLRGQPYPEVLNWACSEAGVAAMSISALSRILHSALVLRAPQLYPLLMTYIPLLLHVLSSAKPGMAQECDAQTLAVLINAYGRAGVRHEKLYAAFCEHASVALRDPSLTIAHVANVSHALSKVSCRHPALLSTLRDQAVRQKQSASPLMAITLLNAFAELNFVDEEMFCVYEQHLLEHLHQLTPPLLASLLHCLVQAGRGSGASTLVERIGEQAQRSANTFDAFATSKVMTAYFAAGQFSEEVFGALAERACAVASDFRSDEVARILEALSAFDLFDGELFPLLATRLATLIKQGAAPVTLEDAAAALASFAAVQEPNDELTHWCGKVFAEYADASVLSAEAYINVIWSCMTLNIRSEAHKKFVEAVRAQLRLILQPLADEVQRWHPQKKTILEERRAKIVKAELQGWWLQSPRRGEMHVRRRERDDDNDDDELLKITHTSAPQKSCTPHSTTSLLCQSSSTVVHISRPPSLTRYA